MPAPCKMDAVLSVAIAVDKEALLRTALGLDKRANRADRNRAAALLQPHLFAVAFAVARRFPNIDAYDCALEAVQMWWCFAAAFAFTKYDPNRPLLPFAYQSLRYITIGLAKSKQRRSYEIVETQVIANVDGDPCDDAERRELNSALDLAIKRLPPHMQAAIRMRFEQEMLLREIGDILGVTALKIHRWIVEALATLKNDLADFRP